ncbi:GAD-like domain-containing protein [Pseudomonas sp. PSKL.D1]|uniref:GAD-like domain-containing protein n=1 Tax=Pseudomonas sp. PSKL.D1 TaxID=3029060 RepID=UPI0023810A8D|nr:GAD-like domain-containing protein [Pseudomonas sp. PSKL.D1]WDY56096.1 GAD-like domain-containing protein [Pseudomonas sp. PSKL.D1]
MDRLYARFLEKVGKATGRQEVPPSSIERYEGKLPDLLLKYWVEHGWCAYGNGIFWLVNPQDYEGVVTSWLEGTTLEPIDTYHLIARGAFGDLYFWGEKTGASLEITAPLSRYILRDSLYGSDQLEKNFQCFFINNDAEQSDYGELFAPALKKLGPLKSNEVYGFRPALLLGGHDSIKNLEKVSVIEHLTLLSQIQKLEPYDFSSGAYDG